MRWEGAAKRSEGSRAWGCKHCRGREEGIGRNRSQRWFNTEYVRGARPIAALLFPTNQAPASERSTTFSWIGREPPTITAPQASVCSYLWRQAELLCRSEIITIYRSSHWNWGGIVVSRSRVFVASEGILCLGGGAWARLFSISSDRVDITPRQDATKENKWPDKPALSV